MPIKKTPLQKFYLDRLCLWIILMSIFAISLVLVLHFLENLSNTHVVLKNFLVTLFYRIKVNWRYQSLCNFESAPYILCNIFSFLV